MYNFSTRQDIAEKIQTGELTIIKFGATWCGPCQIMKYHLEQLEKQLRGFTVHIFEVDVDHEQEFAADMDVKTLPTIFVFRRQELVGHIVGADVQRFHQVVFANLQ